MSPPSQDQSNSSQPYNIPLVYDVDIPKSEKAYLIRKSIFVRIQKHLSKKKAIAPFFQNIGAILIGFAGSAFLTAVSIPTSGILYWFLFILTMTLGIVAWGSSYLFKKIEDDHEDLLSELQIIEETQTH